MMHGILSLMVLSALTAAPKFDVQLLDGSQVSAALLQLGCRAASHRNFDRQHHLDTAKRAMVAQIPLY